jgi:hypothetical protein
MTRRESCVVYEYMWFYSLFAQSVSKHMAIPAHWNRGVSGF